jgi:predicted nuclease with TOPRIM domain
VEQVSKQVLEAVEGRLSALEKDNTEVANKLSFFKDRMNKFEDRFDQLSTASDERIEDAITAYLNDSSHFCDCVNSVIENYMEKYADETPAETIRREVRDMINNGDIVVSIDTV